MSARFFDRTAPGRGIGSGRQSDRERGAAVVGVGKGQAAPLRALAA